MKKRILILLFATINLHINAVAANFTVCKSKFALCTGALCESIPGEEGFISCNCEVKDDYSAGRKSCSGVLDSPQGQIIRSRYSPIKAYATCNNNRPWAWCLDSPCYIDKNDSSRASCLCELVKNKGTYVMVTDHFNQSTCNAGLYSSVTVEQVNQMTDFLREHPELPIFPIQVLNSQ